MTDEMTLLRALVAELRDLVPTLGPEGLRLQAYPSEWTVADVLSHLGSGAVIHARRIDEVLGGPDVDAESIWAEWNAKTPDAKATDALQADQALIQRLDGLTDDERARFSLVMGPMTFDLAGFVRLRINEHTLHSWDIAVVFEPTATLSSEAAEVVLGALPMIGRFAGKATGTNRQIRVRATDPVRTFAISLSDDGVSLSEYDGDDAPDLELPAEALVRLVYGRLDAEHTPDFEGDAADLDELRRAFPGV
jgi:uncharacterized protein (TIGR03083 family)